MSKVNWKYIIRPLGILSLCSIASGFAAQFFPALISSIIYLFVWVHAEYGWWVSGETKEDIKCIKKIFK